MKSGTAVAVAADKPVTNSDCADRILKVIQKAQETTRKEITETLQNRYELEISKLRANFDRRLEDVVAQYEASDRLRIDSAVSAATEAVQQQMRDEAKSTYESKLNDAEKLMAQFKEDATAYANEWRAQRQKLQDRIIALERNLDIAMAVQTVESDSYKDLEQRLKESVDSNEQLQVDLQQAIAELNSRASASTDMTDHDHKQIAAIVQAEMLRVREHLDEIEKALEDGAIELGSEIRLNRERAELQAYLKGLRYSLGEVALQTAAMEDSCHA